jgi:hypothetical protein
MDDSVSSGSLLGGALNEMAGPDLLGSAFPMTMMVTVLSASQMIVWFRLRSRRLSPCSSVRLPMVALTG